MPHSSAATSTAGFTPPFVVGAEHSTRRGQPTSSAGTALMITADRSDLLRRQRTARGSELCLADREVMHFDLVELERVSAQGRIAVPTDGFDDLTRADQDVLPGVLRGAGKRLATAGRFELSPID